MRKRIGSIWIIMTLITVLLFCTTGALARNSSERRAGQNQGETSSWSVEEDTEVSQEQTPNESEMPRQSAEENTEVSREGIPGESEIPSQSAEENTELPRERTLGEDEEMTSVTEEVTEENGDPWINDSNIVWQHVSEQDEETTETTEAQKMEARETSPNAALKVIALAGCILFGGVLYIGSVIFLSKRWRR